MRALKKKRKEDKINMDRIEKRHEKEVKTRETKIKRIETERMVQEETIANLRKQINKLKKENGGSGDEKEVATENRKKIRDIRDKNETMKNNIKHMQSEIVGKNSRIAQLFRNYKH